MRRILLFTLLTMTSDSEFNPHSACRIAGEAQLPEANVSRNVVCGVFSIAVMSHSKRLGLEFLSNDLRNRVNALLSVDDNLRHLV